MDIGGRKGDGVVVNVHSWQVHVLPVRQRRLSYSAGTGWSLDPVFSIAKN